MGTRSPLGKHHWRRRQDILHPRLRDAQNYQGRGAARRCDEHDAVGRCGLRLLAVPRGAGRLFGFS